MKTHKFLADNILHRCHG